MGRTVLSSLARSEGLVGLPSLAVFSFSPGPGSFRVSTVLTCWIEIRHNYVFSSDIAIYQGKYLNLIVNIQNVCAYTFLRSNK